MPIASTAQGKRARKVQTVESTAAAADGDEPEPLTLSLACSDGELELPLHLVDPDADVMMTLYLKCRSDDPNDRKADFIAIELNY